MKSTLTKNEDATVRLVVEIDEEVWQNAQKKLMDAAVKKVEVEGFRKGHAPRKLAEKHINKQAVMYDAIEAVADDALIAGVKEHDLEPVAPAKVDVQAMTEEALTLIFDITVKPEVVLGDYKGIEVEAKDISVSDEDVQAELVKIQEENADFVVVEDGVVEDGNTVVIDFEGFKDGEAFEGGKGENYSLEIGSNTFIPGFEEALIGMKSGEEKDIDLTFPEDYGVEELKGQAVVFHVVLHEIKQRELPAIDDDLVALLEDETISTVDELKAKIKHDLEHRREHEEEHRVSDILMETIVSNAKIDVPEVMVEGELDQMVQEFNQRLSQQGMSMEIYTQFTGQTMEDMREQMKENADSRVRSRLVLEAIAKAEGLECDADEINSEYEGIATNYNIELEKVKQIVSEDAVVQELLLRKAMELVQSTRV